jgi:hypothetical protein
MLRNASTIDNYSIVASDGNFGFVSDFLFDDASWSIRWLAVDTGTWLFGRRVLIASSALGRVDAVAKEFSVKLTLQQVKDSPDIDTERPVSRQIETEIYDHYGWTPYWGLGVGTGTLGNYGSLGGVGLVPSPAVFAAREQHIADTRKTGADPHLRSIKAVTGYHIHASDGAIGHIEDFIVDDVDWSIRYLIADTKNWWPGKKVLLSPWSIRDIDWKHGLLHLNVDRQKVKDSPAYELQTQVDQNYEKRFRDHYGY